MIKSFADKRTAMLLEGRVPKGIAHDLALRAQRKLVALHVAPSLDALAARKGNRLETLKDDLAGRRSIRVNDQWRITFVWRDGHAHDVWFGDYH